MQARQLANSPMTPPSATAPSHSTPARVSVSGRFVRVRSSFRARSWRATRATHPVRHGVGRSAPEGCRVSGANSLVGWSRLRLPRDTLSGDPGVDRQPGLYGGLSPSLALVHGSQAVNMATTCSIGSTTNAARATRAFATAAPASAPTKAQRPIHRRLEFRPRNPGRSCERGEPPKTRHRSRARCKNEPSGRHVTLRRPVQTSRVDRLAGPLRCALRTSRSAGARSSAHG